MHVRIIVSRSAGNSNCKAITGGGGMKVLHLNAGNETGGGMFHILRVMGEFVRAGDVKVVLGVLEQGELLRRADALGIKTIYFGGEWRLNVLALFRIIRFIRREQITHVHTHGPRASVYMRLIRPFVNVCWVVTVHSDPFMDFKGQGARGHLFTSMHVGALQRARKVISVCDAFRPQLTKAGIIDVTTIRNGIDFSNRRKQFLFEQADELAIDMRELGSDFLGESRADLRARDGFREKDFLLLSVARLEAVKGHETLLKAFAKFMEQTSQCAYLLLVGSGSLREVLGELAKVLGIADRVKFYGEQSDVQQFYQMADVCVLASVSESFPYVLLESAREGTAVIATDVGDVGRLITGPEYGFKVKPADVSELADAMGQAFRGREGLKKIGNNLQKVAQTQFSLAKCVEEVYNVYVSDKVNGDL